MSINRVILNHYKEKIKKIRKKIRNRIVIFCCNHPVEGKQVNIDGVIYWQYFCSRCKTIHYEKSVNQKDIGDLYESNNTEKTNQGKETR